MTYLVFQNPGRIEPGAFTIIGAHAKPNSSNPIGHFGTGLKIAIAQVLANNGKITIWSGLQSYRFHTKAGTFRGEPMEEIYCTYPDGKVQLLGFTTALGKNWEPWMVFRELESNVRDEDGQSFVTDSRVDRTSDSTTIVVSGWPELIDAFGDRNKYFLNTGPLLVTDDLEIHPYNGHPYFYYHGIKVGEFSIKPSFTYNFTGSYWKNMLTEDRTLSAFVITPAIERFLATTDNYEIQKTWLGKPVNSVTEHSISFALINELSPAFIKAVNELTSPKNEWLEAISRITGYLDRPKALLMTSGEKALLDATINRIDLALGTNFAESKIPIHRASLIGKYGVCYRANENQPTEIFIDAEVFNQPNKLLSTLLEELIHGQFNIGDYTREFQDKLLDYIELLIGKLAAAN